MTEPVNNKTLGGLTYNANLVKSAKKLKDGQYELIFKSGEKFTYPEQKPFTPNFSTEGASRGRVDKSPTAITGEKLPEGIRGGEWIDKDKIIPRNAKIEQRIDGSLIYDDTYFSITNVMGGHFTSSENTVSHVTLNNSSNTTIDLAANDSKWFADEANVEYGANNTVILDKQDVARIEGHQVEGEGTATQKDYKSNNNY